MPTPGGVPVKIRSPGSSVTILREVGDHLVDAEDQLLGVRVLHRLAVEPEPDAQVVRVGRPRRP